MSRPRRSSALLAAVLPGTVLLATGTAACVDFVDPEPRPTQLLASLLLEDGKEAPTARLLGSVTAATPSEGPPAALLEPVRVWDRSVSPEPGTTPGVLRYRDEWTPSEEDLASGRVTFSWPPLDGGTRPPPLIIPLTRRAGPDSLALGPGEDLELPLLVGRDPPVGSAPASESISWFLQVQEDADVGRSLVSASGRGAPPDTLGVSASLLGDGSTPLRVEVQVSRSAEAAATDYPVRFTVVTRLRWTVRFDEEP